MIQLQGVVKRYDGKAAVDAIDLEIPKGSVFGLIGPNGAGKTTTLKMIATLIQPDEGSVRIAGHELPRQVAEARRTIGYMPDRQGQFRGLTALDYLAYFGRLHGISGRALQQRIDTILELTDLGGVRDELVSALSTGMRQRLALAKTLLHDPEILILDEPASGLDPRARIEIRELLKELGRMGKTVVISSHILADLEEISTSIGIIEQGKLLAAGGLEEIRRASSSGRRTVRVKVSAERRSASLEIVARTQGVSTAEGVGEDEVRAALDGISGNAILRALIEGEIEVLEFSEQRVSLEAIFMDRTKGLVQ